VSRRNDGSDDVVVDVVDDVDVDVGVCCCTRYGRKAALKNSRLL
jgi:catabolite regulation protein CreA